MLWYLLFALVFFSLALFAAHFHKHATAECRSIRLTRGGVLSVALLGIIGFYPLLVLYFRLYPVSASDHLTVTMAFTCSKMRPDGFGGLAMLITADTIRSESAHTLLDRFYKEALAQGEVRHGDS